MFGFMKFGSKQMVEGFNHYGYSSWFRVFTGIVEVVSAILVIAGIWNESLAAWGSVIILITMIGAIMTREGAKVIGCYINPEASVLVNLKKLLSSRHYCRRTELPISLALTMQLTAEHLTFNNSFNEK